MTLTDEERVVANREIAEWLGWQELEFVTRTEWLSPDGRMQKAHKPPDFFSDPVRAVEFWEKCREQKWFVRSTVYPGTVFVDTLTGTASRVEGSWVEATTTALYRAWQAAREGGG